jgi:hypothetical protein
MYVNILLHYVCAYVSGENSRGRGGGGGGGALLEKSFLVRGGLSSEAGKCICSDV